MDDYCESRPHQEVLEHESQIAYCPVGLSRPRHKYIVEDEVHSKLEEEHSHNIPLVVRKQEETWDHDFYSENDLVVVALRGGKWPCRKGVEIAEKNSYVAHDQNV